jgi:hypothetical protein
VVAEHEDAVAERGLGGGGPGDQVGVAGAGSSPGSRRRVSLAGRCPGRAAAARSRWSTVRSNSRVNDPTRSARDGPRHVSWQTPTMRVVDLSGQVRRDAVRRRGAAAVEAGWLPARPRDEVVLAAGRRRPGFVEVLAPRCPAPRAGADRRPARAAGSGGVPARRRHRLRRERPGLRPAPARPGERDPNRTTSYGLGLLLFAAVESGRRGW